MASLWTFHGHYTQVPGVGFNDVVIETPLHNMCAALEQEESLGHESKELHV